MLQHFCRIASGLEVEPLVGALERAPWLWAEFTARQTTPGSPHADTEAIFLRWCESQSVEAAFTEIPAIDYPALAHLPEARPLIAEIMKRVEATKLGRVMIARLKPGGYIDPHADEGAYADYYERFHVVLDSELGNLFFSGTPLEQGEFVHMKRGEGWWFNHKQMHWLMNQSQTPRTHLIIDAVAPNYRMERHAIPA